MTISLAFWLLSMLPQLSSHRFYYRSCSFRLLLSYTKPLMFKILSTLKIWVLAQPTYFYKYVASLQIHLLQHSFLLTVPATLSLYFNFNIPSTFHSHSICTWYSLCLVFPSPRYGHAHPSLFRVFVRNQLLREGDTDQWSLKKQPPVTLSSYIALFLSKNYHYLTLRYVFPYLLSPSIRINVL